ncbi:MAG: kelch repeat-containing protein, partial [Candidatus Cloacimonadaceae bacterium]|nr:kelch repeat-containing protein [Candidatus Cloacimonadaceae bacterium]
NVKTNAWSALTVLPEARVLPATAVVNNKLYVMGGSFNSLYWNTVYIYDLLTNQWLTPGAAMPATLAWHKAVSYQNRYIYIAGGINAVTGGVYQSAVHVYDTVTNTWTTATSMPAGRFGGAFAITGNSLVYTAGVDAAGYLTNTIYVGTISANPAVIDWITARSSYPGISNAGSGPMVNLAALEASHQKGDYRLADYPAGGMYRFDGGTWGDNSIIVAGGSNTGDWIPTNPSPAYRYNPTTDTWTQQPNLLTPVLGAYFSTVKTGPTTWNAVVASGYTGATSTPATQIYTKILGAPPVPETPTNVVIVTGPGAGQVSISWNAMPNATWYGIYAGSDPGNLVYLGWVSGNSYSVVAGSKGFYKITAGS